MDIATTAPYYGLIGILLSLFLPLRLNPRGGHQTDIPEYQVLRRLVGTK